MDIRQLRYFVACVEEGSILGAAQRLRVAQPALSRQIKELENDLGCQLLVREARGVRMTPAGSSLYNDAVALLSSFEQATQRAARVGADQGSILGFGAVRTSSRFDFLHQGLKTFRETSPEVRVEVSCSSSRQLLSSMAREKIEVAVLYQPPADSVRFKERSIHFESYILAIHPSHHLASRQSIRIGDLAGEPLVWLSRLNNPDNHDRLMQQCRSHGLEPLIASQADTQDEQLELLSICGGICLTPASTRLVEPVGRFVFKEIDDCRIELQLRLVWRSGLESAQTANLLGHMNAAIDEHQRRIRKGQAAWATMSAGRKLARCP